MFTPLCLEVIGTSSALSTESSLNGSSPLREMSPWMKVSPLSLGQVSTFTQAYTPGAGHPTFLKIMATRCLLLTDSVTPVTMESLSNMHWLVITIYCLNPNSTNSSVQQNLRFRLHSYTIIHPPTTTNYLLLLLTAPASQALRLYNYTLTASQAGKLY